MEVVRLEATIQIGGIVSVEGVKAGERIEVIVLRLDNTPNVGYPLRGTPYRLDRPFEPMIP